VRRNLAQSSLVSAETAKELERVGKRHDRRRGQTTLHYGEFLFLELLVGHSRRRPKPAGVEPPLAFVLKLLGELPV